ncbi:hypothetical protein HYPSUDRAFT_62615 [Hypholoma sublateritium FD-334 SS-4]|uniref:Uncharacterized protein n=1 Tax=Hypholoma sublateritium (strain FD-334 SS-4) TaxID=945553 RepID=A0A0D2LKJ1_HYPSF|nr:hypothetical protein HYPSUDRAFT_62615 [Hypholoma sublateritium FD-334 SS-4]
MDNYAMDPHYQQRQQQWDHYPHYFHDAARTTNLTLNLSSLSVASPTNISPITAPAPPSPSSAPFAHHLHHHHPFAFDPASGQQSPHYDDQHQHPQAYDPRRTPAPSRSSSASSSQLPRKRSFTNASPAPAPPAGLSINTVSVGSPLVEEAMYDDEARDAAMELASAVSYDDLDARTPYGAPAPSAGTNSVGNGSPVDGSGSASGEDSFNVMQGVGGSMTVLGKPLATNNFVTKLYQ